MDLRELAKKHIDLVIVVVGLLAIALPAYVSSVERLARLEAQVVGSAIQSGVLEFQALQDSGPLGFVVDETVNSGDRRQAGWWVAERKVNLDPTKCRDHPTVVAMLSGMDVGTKAGYPTTVVPDIPLPNSVAIKPENVGNLRIIVSVEGATKEAFTLKVHQWADTKIFWVQASWIAQCHAA